MLLHALAACTALAAEPQCPPYVLPCVWEVTSRAFGDAYYSYASEEAISTWAELSSTHKAAMCDADAWRAKETCNAACPMALEITEPANMRYSMCVADNMFLPYLREGHIDLHHPLNGVDLELIAPGEQVSDERREGCLKHDFDDGKNYTGKLVLLRRGTCRFTDKFANARMAGASVGLLMNNHMTNSVEQNMYHMTGASDGIDMPAVFTATHNALTLYAALDAGVRMRGRLRLSCDRDIHTPEPLPGKAAVHPPNSTSRNPEAPVSSGTAMNTTSFAHVGTVSLTEDAYAAEVEDYFTDGCPHVALIARAHDAAPPCGSAVKEENRLCTRCPVEFAFDNAGGGRACLWGNYLLPRRRRNHLQHTFVLPDVGAARGVALLSKNADGCDPASYENLDGYIVFAPRVTTCIPYASVLAASRAGAAAFVMLMPHSGTGVDFVEGASEFVPIPVHTVVPYQALAIEQFFVARGRVVDGGHHVVDGTGSTAPYRFFNGEFPPYIAPNVTEAPPVQEREMLEWHSAAFDWTPAACVATAVVLLTILVIVVYSIYSQRRRDRVLKETAAKLSGRGISLGVASTSLSLTLLLGASFTAFALAYTSGRQGTDDALEAGQLATAQTYETAVISVDALADDLRQSVLKSLGQRLENVLGGGELLVEQVARLYKDSNGSYASILSHYDYFVELWRASPRRDAMSIHMTTVTGYYMSNQMLTRAPPMSEWGSTAVAKDPKTMTDFYYYDDNALRNTFWFVYTPEQFDPFVWVGGEHGDRATIMRGRPRSLKRWHVTRENQNFVHFRPITVFSPVLARDGTYLGVAEVHVEFKVLGDLLSDIATGKYENMTVFIYDSAETVLDCNVHPSSYQTNVFLSDATQGNSASYTLENHPLVEVNAFRHFTAAGTGETEFDQREYYKQLDARSNDLRVVGGRMRDTSPNGNDVEVQGPGCDAGGCVVYDTALGKNVAVFAGENVGFIYRNLSVDHPRVAATRLPTRDGSWASSWPPYEQTMAYGKDGASTCVAHTSPITKETTCYLEGSIWGAPFTVVAVFQPSHNAAMTTLEQMVERQWVFSDTASGDANIRIYADGSAAILVLQGGCRTGPVPNIKGQWTHFAFVVQRSLSSGYQCVAYVNGTVHEIAYATAQYSPQSTYIQTHTPYTFGNGFIGRIAQVTLYNVSITADEARYIYEHDGQFQRVVPSKEWFAGAVDLEVDTSEVEGLEWTVVGLVPEADLFREVFEQHAYYKERLVVQRHNLDVALKQRTRTSLLILVATIALGMLIFLVFNDYLTRPFADVAQVMTDAAYMCIREVATQDSVVTELKIMYHAMDKMLRNLESFRPYLPDTLFQNTAFLKARSRIDAAPGITTGMVCIVFTDIVSSTKTWEGCPEGMKKGLKLHNEVMREAIKKYNGYEVKTVGDAFMVAFESASDAVNFALAAHVGLYEAQWPQNLLNFETCAVDTAQNFRGIKVRIGVHFGEVDAEFNQVLGRYDYLGNTVNRAARTEAAAVPGTVALTPDVLEELMSECDGGAADAPEFSLDFPVETYMLERVSMHGVARPITLTMAVPEPLAKRRDFVLKVIADKTAARAKEVEDKPLDGIAGGVDRRRAPSMPNSSTASFIGLGRSGPSAGLCDRLERYNAAVLAKVLLTYEGDFMLNPAAALSLDAAMAKLLSASKRLDGTLLSVVSSSVLITFNAAKPIARPLDRAIRFVRTVSQSCFGSSKVQGIGGLHAGVCHGPALYGNVGNKAQKFITAVAPSVSVADHLVQVAGSLNCFCLLGLPLGLNCDRNIPQQTSARTRVIDVWTSVGDDSVQWRIEEVMGSIRDGTTPLTASAQLQQLRSASKTSETHQTPGSPPACETAGESSPVVVPPLLQTLSAPQPPAEQPGSAGMTPEASSAEQKFSLEVSDNADASAAATALGGSGNATGNLQTLPFPVVRTETESVPSAAHSPLVAPDGGGDPKRAGSTLSGIMVKSNANVSVYTPGSFRHPPCPPCPDRQQWGWSAQYEQAFAEGDYALILDSTDDPVLQAVAANIRDKRSFVLPIRFVCG